VSAFDSIHPEEMRFWIVHHCDQEIMSTLQPYRSKYSFTFIFGILLPMEKVKAMWFRVADTKNQTAPFVLRIFREWPLHDVKSLAFEFHAEKTQVLN